RRSPWRAIGLVVATLLTIPVLIAGATRGGPTAGAGTAPSSDLADHPGAAAADDGRTAVDDGAPTTSTVAEGPEGVARSEEGEDAAPLTPPLARLGPLELYLPAAEPIVVGYHEGAHVSAV